jgi:hypothetical protein
MQPLAAERLVAQAEPSVEAQKIVDSLPLEFRAAET